MLCIRARSLRHRGARLQPILVVALATFAFLSVGCFGKKEAVYSQQQAGELLQRKGVDAFAQAEFGKIDRLVEGGEFSTARSLLDNMPRALRDTPLYHYRVAYVATLDADYAKATRAIEAARIQGGYTTGAAELAIFLNLLNGKPTEAASIATDVLLREPRRTLVWQYLIDAVSRDPVTEGSQQVANTLLRKYPRLPETRVLSAVIVFSQGHQDSALKWMKELSEQLPANTTVNRVYLDMLRVQGDWESVARVGRRFAETLEEDSPLRAHLVEEMESIRLTQLLKKSDPLPAAVRLDVSGEKIKHLAEQVPVGVPLNNNDPRDGMPPDFLDEEGKPLYFLPFQAGRSYCLGVRPDAVPGGNAPAMRDPETEYRPAHAYDFLMPDGSEVLAARGGVVKRVSAFSADGKAEYNNVIEIFHRDGTIGRYWHIDRQRVIAHPGDVVYRGQPIAGSGKTGRSRHQHLRFEVVEKVPLVWWRKYVFKGGKSAWWEPYREWKTLPIKFADVSEEDGMPREGRWYRSRNVWVPNVY